MYVGFSMGGQQAFHWGVLYGDSTGAIVPVAGTAKTSVHNWLFLEGLKKALQADSSFNGGDYKSPPEAGLRAFSTVYASWWYDQTGYREGLHLKTFDGFPDMNAFLDFAYSVFNSFDANDLLAMLNTWQIADVGQQQRYGGDWKAALGDIHCHALVMPSKTDLYFPPEDNEIEVALMPNAELLVIPSKRGHFGGSMVPGLAPEEAFFTDVAIKRLLKSIG
jgi:homoserine O-acetyltransferase